MGAGNGAKDFWLKTPAGMDRYYDRVPPDDPPQPGDVVIWGANKYNSYGHIGVVTATTPGGFTSFEQNSPIGGAATSKNHDYANVLGYLRPR